MGAGAFGSALAHVWLNGGARVKLWCRDPAQAAALAQDGLNPKVAGCPTLPGVQAGTLDAFETVGPQDVVVLVLLLSAQGTKLKLWGS